MYAEKSTHFDLSLWSVKTQSSDKRQKYSTIFGQDQTTFSPSEFTGLLGGLMTEK